MKLKLILVTVVLLSLASCTAPSPEIEKPPVILEVEEVGDQRDDNEPLVWYSDSYEEKDIEYILSERRKFWDVVVANSELSYFVQGESWGEDRVKSAYEKLELPESLEVPWFEANSENHSHEEGEEHDDDETATLDLTRAHELLNQGWVIENSGEIGEALFYVQTYSPNAPKTLSFDYMAEFRSDLDTHKNSPNVLEQVKVNLLKKSLDAQAVLLDTLLDISFSQSLSLTSDYITSNNIDIMGLQAYMNYYINRTSVQTIAEENILYREKYFPLIEEIQEVVLSAEAPTVGEIKRLRSQCIELSDELEYTDVNVLNPPSDTTEQVSEETWERLQYRYMVNRVFRQFTYNMVNFVMPELLPSTEDMEKLLYLCDNMPSEESKAVVLEYVESGNPEHLTEIAFTALSAEHSSTYYRNSEVTRGSQLAKLFQAQNIAYSNMSKTIGIYADVIDGCIKDYTEAWELLESAESAEMETEAVKRMLDAEQTMLSALAHMKWSLNIDTESPPSIQATQIFCQGVISPVLDVTNSIVLKRSKPTSTLEEFRKHYEQLNLENLITEWYMFEK